MADTHHNMWKTTMAGETSDRKGATMEMKEYTVNRTGKTTVRTGQDRREKGHGNNVELGERYYVAAVYEFQWSGAYFYMEGQEMWGHKKA